MFRTADAAGVSRVLLSGYTPQPRDKFERVQKDIAKTALGAEACIPWEYVKSPASLVKRYRAEGWQIVGVELDRRAQDLQDFKRKEKVLYIFGNEVRGLSGALRDSCDVLVQIPMRGKKESLNVAVTAGIILFSNPPRS